MQSTSSFIKGMNQDVHPKYQMEGSYRFALNAVLETKEGELPVISNELGNIKCAVNFPESKIIIGHVLLPDNTVVLFLYDPQTDHEIGIYDPASCSYTTKLKGSCLNFSDKHQINAIFRIKNGCDYVVYFASEDNKYRVVNLNKLSKIVDSNKNIIDCSSILYTKEFTYPCLRMLEGEGDTGIKDTSGVLEIGTYYFSVRYMDYEQNTTDWLFTSRPIAVGDELYRYVYNQSTVSQYDGGSNNPDSDYYVAPTNKVININVFNPDKRYPFIQFAVIKRTADSGAITDVDILNPHPIPQEVGVSSFIYTYTGLDSQVESKTSLQDILTPRKKVHKVKAHTIHNNRLMLGNVAQDYVDYSSYQRFASKIKTEWTKINVNSPQNSRNKQASYYFYDASFMEDEIYALGIVYIHRDGTQSPVMHIPGRPLNDVTNNAYNPHIGTNGIATDGGNWDDEDGLIEARAYGSVWNFSKTKRWQVTSTAYKYGSNASPRGMMGYHQTTTKYPEVTNCDNHPDGYWGRDYKGNLITSNSNIRHHRMPSAELTDTSNTAHGHKLGIRFTNVEYPNSNVVGHFFVSGDRTTERTIMAKGLLVPIFEYNTEFEGLYFNNTSICPPNNYTWPIGDSNNHLNKRIFAFISSDGLYDAKSYQPSYIKIEKVMEDTQFNVDNGASNAKDSFYNDVIQLEPYQVLIRDTHSEIWFMKNYVSPKVKNYGITNAGFLQKAATSAKIGDFMVDSNSSNTKIYNNSVSTNIQILVTDSTSNSPVEHIRNQSTGRISQNKLLYASIRQDVDVFNNLASIQYNRLDNCRLIASSPNEIFTTYSGDTFIARVNITDSSYYQQGNSSTNSTIHEDIRMVSYLAEESNMNPEFRHSGKKPQSLYFKYTYTYDHKPLIEYLRNKTFNVYNTTYNDADRYIYGLYPEEYNYNKSFSYLSPLDKYLPPPLFYDFCNECIDDNPYRIYASEFDTNEGVKDLFRIIYENNYRDLEGYTGEITDMFVSFDKLYAATTTSLFHIPTKFNVMNTDDSTIYLGTGEIFSMPPKEMKNVDFAFGGSQYFKSRVPTEYGTFYVDALSKRPILFTDNFNDLSNTGLRNFFQENGAVMFKDQFKSLTGVEYTNSSTSSNIGVGYISTYDPRYKRIIIHKRDYKILPQFETTFKYQVADIASITNPNNSIIFNGTNFYYRDKDGNNNIIIFDNDDYFENKSFTLSYSFLTNSFISFHSYLPNYMFNDKDTFFTIQRLFSNSPYKHSFGNYQTYFDNKYDHVIDFITKASPNIPTIPTNIFYYSTTYLNDSILDDTYSYLTVYNSNQSTGKLKLKEKQIFEFDNSPVEALVSKVDKYYRINNIRNVSNGTPIWTSDWNSIKSYPYNYIDKVVNDVVMDYTGFDYTSSRLRDFYTGIRFYFNPENNLKITTDLVNTIQANRNR